MAAKLTRLTHKTAIQLQVMAESCTICSSRSRRTVRQLLDTPSQTEILPLYVVKLYLIASIMNFRFAGLTSIQMHIINEVQNTNRILHMRN
jgi:hypothetical protein